MCTCCNVCVLGRRCRFTLFQVHVWRWLAGFDVPRGECIPISCFPPRNIFPVFYLTIVELIDVITQCLKFSGPGHDSDFSAKYLACGQGGVYFKHLGKKEEVLHKYGKVRVSLDCIH